MSLKSSHLYEGPAASNKVIMRMILALAACDMHRNGLVIRSPGRPTADDHGRYHYGLAVKEFRQLLETPRQVSLDEVETVFATVFLMIAWEWQFGHSVRHVRILCLQRLISYLTLFVNFSFNFTFKGYDRFWKHTHDSSGSRI